MSRTRLFLLLSAAALLPLRKVSAQSVPEPPLPGEEGPVTPGEAFSFLPGPEEIPPESMVPEDMIVEPPPDTRGLDQLEDIEPLGMPSDGEPMPAMPHVPGLVLPKPPAAMPGRNLLPGTPDAPGMLPDLLPPADLQLTNKSLWYKSPLAARRAAVAEDKPLLLFFAQMPDKQCLSAQLHDDLFLLEEFNSFASAKLVLTKLQYPVGSRKNHYPEAKLAALKQFQTYFKVTGFPAVVVIDKSGRELERFKGYRQVVDASGQKYSTASTLLDRLKEAASRHEERRRYRTERIASLLEQGFRQWTSRKGSSMMGRLVTATPEYIILSDENGRKRSVLPAQLTLYDSEWARRKQAGLIPPPETPPKETAASGLPVEITK